MAERRHLAMDQRIEELQRTQGIIPGWNWNHSRLELESFQVGIGIIPGWNWNHSRLELESFQAGIGIIPGWNWNHSRLELESFQVGIGIIPGWNSNCLDRHIQLMSIFDLLLTMLTNGPLLCLSARKL